MDGDARTIERRVKAMEDWLANPQFLERRVSCSLCMGNQARVADNTTVVSTSGCCSTPSTRNFPNRLGKGANVYLASAELATVSAKLGKLPTVAEYMEFANKIAPMAANIYRYLNFHEIEEYQSVAQKVIPIAQAA